MTTPEQAHNIAQVADGVVVGSALVELLINNQHQEFLQLAKELSHAIHY